MKKSLVILGNGFDKNLGLKTGYWDYFEYTLGSKIKKYIDIIIGENINKYSNEFEEIYELKYKILEIEYNSILEDIIEKNLSNNDKIKEIINVNRNNILVNNINLNNYLYEYNSENEIHFSLDNFKGDFFNKLKFNEKPLHSFGLFISFLLLLEPEYDNWYSIEEQIVEYVEDTIDIIEYIYSNDNKFIFF